MKKLLKFRFNLTSQTLQKWTGENFSPVSDENQFPTQFGGLAWWLDHQHWISFTLTKTKITVFYKQPDKEQFLYYRKEVPRQDIVTFRFTSKDQMIKNQLGRWVKKTTP